MVCLRSQEDFVNKDGKIMIKLKRLTDEIMNLATSVVDDYEMNPSEMSGSVTQIHIDSPILEDEEPVEDKKR